MRPHSDWAGPPWSSPSSVPVRSMWLNAMAPVQPWGTAPYRTMTGDGMVFWKQRHPQMPADIGRHRQTGIFVTQIKAAKYGNAVVMIFQFLLQEKRFHLQDPIEVSALRMVMQETHRNLWKLWDWHTYSVGVKIKILHLSNSQSHSESLPDLFWRDRVSLPGYAGMLISWQERPSPIMNTSAKTNLGHLEASAGMAGCAIAADFEVLWMLVGFWWFCGIPGYLHDSWCLFWILLNQVFWSVWTFLRAVPVHRTIISASGRKLVVGRY